MTEIKKPELGYYDTAINIPILIRDLYPHLTAEIQNEINNMKKYILDARITFERFYSVEDEFKNGMTDKYSLTYTPEGFIENEENSKYVFRTMFIRKCFQLNINEFKKKWLNDAAYRREVMIELNMNKGNEIKNNFQPKQESGLTEYEEEMFNQAQGYVGRGTNILKREKRTVDQIALAFEKVVIEKTEQRQNTIGLKMKEFKVI